MFAAVVFSDDAAVSSRQAAVSAGRHPAVVRRSARRVRQNRDGSWTHDTRIHGGRGRCILSVVEGLWWSCFDGFRVMYVYKMLEFDQDFSYLHLLCRCWFIWVCASLLVECIKGLTILKVIWVHCYSRSKRWNGGLVWFIDRSFTQSNNLCC